MRMLKSYVSAFTLVAVTVGGAAAEGVDELPPDIAAAYQGLDAEQPVGPSPYRDWSAPDGPPWTIGYASSYAGNSWRAAAIARLNEVLLPRYQDAGLIDEVIVTESELNDSVQIQQMRQLVDQGADAIIICCSNITALNQTVAYANNKGVPVFSWSGYVTSPYAISASANYNDGGYRIATSFFEHLGGSGSVLLVSGIPGLASSDSFDAGVNRALEEFPDIELVGTVAGQWTDQVAQVEVQTFLATHPAEIDGIIVQSPAETGVLQAMLQSGRPMVPITLSGQVGTACYWKQNPDWMSEGYYMWPPGDEFELVFDVMIRTLQGQGPKVQSIVREVLPFTLADIEGQVPEDCSTESTDWIEPPIERWFPPETAEAFFLRPEDPLNWSR